MRASAVGEESRQTRALERISKVPWEIIHIAALRDSEHGIRRISS
jgi:hypothetical protein